ncbi:MAPK/MAK/MRK overlapping kinase-like [Tachypleus tridentatus]|uniref:MAPK/MAK/MRK overlapping kinase-like n=1 Tax=Tachypleus tridentatus TaxID=6853 RepID=UPI003FD1AB71
MFQLFKSLDYIHSNGIFHRDIKPENILIRDSLLKLADFGSCRSMYTTPPYTEYIATRWYRPPECLLTNGYYTYKMDIWAAGCVFFEILTNKPLFPGSSEMDQIAKIHDVIGSPRPRVLAKLRKRKPPVRVKFPKKTGWVYILIPHVSPNARDLLMLLLIYDEEERISTAEALRNPFFTDLRISERHQVCLQELKDSRTKEKVRYTEETDSPRSIVPTIELSIDTAGSDPERQSRNKIKTTNQLQKKLHLPHLGTADQMEEASSDSDPSQGECLSMHLPSLQARSFLRKSYRQPSTLHDTDRLPSIHRHKRH